MNNELLEALYAGWCQYRKEIKGYLSTPNLAEIEDWEYFKTTVMEGVKDEVSVT